MPSRFSELRAVVKADLKVGRPASRRARTAIKTLEYEKLYGKQTFETIPEIDKAAGAIADPGNVETIPLSRRSDVDRSARIGGRRASDQRATEQALAREVRGEDVWGNVGRKSDIEVKREALKRKNLKRNAQVETIHSVVPGRPVSNTNPVGGRIEGLMGKFRSWIKTGFNSPFNKGTFMMGTVVADIMDAIRGTSFGAVKLTKMSSEKLSTNFRGGFREITAILKSTGDATGHLAPFRKEAAQFLRDLRAAEKGGFPEPIIFRKDIVKNIAGLEPRLTPKEVSREFRSVVLHERIHDIRMKSGEFGKTQLDMSKGLSQFVVGLGYPQENIVEELIAYGHQARYIGLNNPLNSVTQLFGEHTDELVKLTENIPRPRSNVNPIGGRIRGMQGVNRSNVDTGFKSPWRGIIGISKEVTALYISRLGGKKFGGLLAPSDIRSSIASLKQYIPRKAESYSPAYNKFLRHKLAQHAVQLRAAKRVGFENAILIPKGVPGRKGLRATIVHERVHQIRKLEGTFGSYYGRELEVGKEGSDWLQKIGYSESKVREEAIAFGAEFGYMARRSATKVGNAGMEKILEPISRIMEGDIAGDLMDYAKVQKASWDIRPFIKKNLSKQIQRDTLKAMSNTANAQTRNTVSGLSTSLHQSRGIRKGPSGGNG